MLNPKEEREAIETLKSILRFIGADEKFAYYAQLHTYMEWFKNK